MVEQVEALKTPRTRIKELLAEAEILSESTIVINGFTIKEVVAKWPYTEYCSIKPEDYVGREDWICIKILWARNDLDVFVIDGVKSPLTYADFIVKPPYIRFITESEHRQRNQVRKLFNEYWGTNI